MKLSAEEQEKMKLENYKMLSAISGKNLNDFIGNTDKSNYNEKDCKSKEIILNALFSPSTSNELYKNIKNVYDGKYKTFTSLLVRYQKAGFIKKLNNQKPIIYGLTEFGKENARNPKLLREENIKRYREFQLNKLKQIIEGEPEVFKNLYESIFGAQNSVINTVVSGGSQYSPNDYGGEIVKEIEGKIYSPDFWKNSNDEKIKSLVDGILDPCLTDEEKQELLFDAFTEALNSNKGSMILQKQYNPSKPVGLRNYYEILVKCINKVVSKSTYEAIPFRFVYIPNKRELRLESEAIAGKYRNNQDGTVLGYEYLNENLFGGRMYITTGRHGDDDEMVFYYTKMIGTAIAKQYQITTMSLTDYEKAKNKHQPTLKIKVN